MGEITDAEIVSRTPGKSVFGAIVENETGAVRILFFNQPFRAEQLTFGRHVMISGEPKLNGLRMEFIHPKVTILDDRESMPKPRILPIYPLTEGVKQSDLATTDCRSGWQAGRLARRGHAVIAAPASCGRVGGIEHSTRAATAGDYRGD